MELCTSVDEKTLYLNPTSFLEKKFIGDLIKAKDGLYYNIPVKGFIKCSGRNEHYRLVYTIELKLEGKK